MATIRSCVTVITSFAAVLAIAAPAFAGEINQSSGPGDGTSREAFAPTPGDSRPEAERAVEAATLYVQLGAYHMAYQQLFAVDQVTFRDKRITAMVQRLEADPRLSKSTMAEIRCQAEGRWARHSK